MAAPFPFLRNSHHDPTLFILSYHREEIRILAKNRMGHLGRFLDLQILTELQRSFGLEGLEEVRLIKDKRTGERSLASVSF